MPEQYSNGTNSDSGDEGREPSYVRLAKYLSGYTTLSYDPSKQVIGRSPSPIRPSKELVKTPPNPPVMENPCSFIEQRIERLYGPGSLAQVFHSRSSSSPRVAKTPQSTPTQNKSDVDTNSKSVPVMRLLRPEFRAQLNSATPISPSAVITPKRIPKKLVTNGDSVDACNPVKKQLIPTEEVKDGHHYLKKHEAEVKKIIEIAVKCETELDSCDSEDGRGILRAIAGKARLLVREKLAQFCGLCNNNINQPTAEEFPTTNEDLAGFWDMVMIQVDDVHKQFSNLDKLRKNNWCEEKVLEKERKATKPPLISKNKTNANSKVQSEASKARDEARRKMILERKAAMKQAQNTAPSAQQTSDSLFIV